MFRIFLIALIFFTAQDVHNIKPIKTIRVNADAMDIDPLQNVYIVSRNRLFKYDKTGTFIAEFADNNLGNITSIDVSDPLRILLFYEEYNQLVFLDNELAEIGSTILLDDLNLGFIKLACSSELGGFWIYSQQMQQLFHVDKNLEVQQKSMQLNAIVQQNFEPNYLVEHSNKVYMNMPDVGIIVLDSYGFYQKTIPINNLDNFQLSGNDLVYFSENALVNYNQDKIRYDTLLHQTNAKIRDIKIQQNLLAMSSENAVEIFLMK